MLRKSWTYAGAAAAALMLAACGTSGADSASLNETATTSARTPAAEPATGAFTDEEIQAYLAARAEIDPIQSRYASMTPQERSQATAQIVEIQQRHNLTAARYDAITRAAQTDTTLASRLTGTQGFTDEQLRSFAAASLEIDPISRNLATASEAERAQAANQIRDILQRHSLDGATYNAIATRAQTDAELRGRIAALQVAEEALEPPSGD